MQVKNLFRAMIAIAVLLTASQPAHAQLQKKENDTMVERTVERTRRTEDTTPVITITTQPVNLTAMAGNINDRKDCLTVEAKVTQGATLSYQWYAGKAASSKIRGDGADVSALPGATGASYPLPVTMQAGTYSFYCEVKATGGAAAVRSNVVTVIVEPQPVITITTQPANASFIEKYIQGGLTVAANVKPDAALSYQWYSNTSANNTGGTAISGATSANFNIPTTLKAGTYYYFCETRSSRATSVRSKVATVTVTIPQPTVTLITTSQTVKKGDVANYIVSLTGFGDIKPIGSATMWRSDSTGTTSGTGHSPTNVTGSTLPAANNQTTWVLKTSASTLAGTYYFRLQFNNQIVSSNVGTLIVTD